MVCSGWKGCQALGDAIVNLRNLEGHTSVKFRVVSFMFRSLIHLDLSLCIVIGMDLFSFFYMMIMPEPFFEYASCSPFYIFCFFVKNQLFIAVWIDF